jgi:hypothetical protein
MDGRQVVKDAALSEASSIVYALSFRAGKSHSRPRERIYRDLKNIECRVEKAVYCIDDAKTDN